MTPAVDEVSASNNLITSTFMIIFDAMQLTSYDGVVLKDILGNTIAFQLNRITFSNLKDNLKADQVYSHRVTSSAGAQEVPLFFSLPWSNNYIFIEQKSRSS